MSLRKKQTPKEEPKTGKLRRWKITFHWPKSPLKKPFFPKEFTCPISLSLMADPVIVSSGQTLDRNCALICKKLSFSPILSNGSVLEFSNIIPNLSLKAAISNWCKTHMVETPKPIDPISAEKLVRKLMASPSRSGAELTRPSQLSSSSVESVTASLPPPTPLPLATRPACLSTSSSSEDTDTTNPNFDDIEVLSEFEDIISKPKINIASKQEKVTKVMNSEFDDIISRPKSNMVSNMVSEQEKVLNLGSSEFDVIFSRHKSKMVSNMISEQEKVLNLGSSQFDDIISRHKSNMVSEQEKVLNHGSSEFDDIFSRHKSSMISNMVSEQEKVMNLGSSEVDNIISRLRTNMVSEQENDLISLRRITRTREETRARLCGPGLLSALRSLLLSRYVNVQVNAVALLVNLSLEDQNKARIVRSGLVPPLISVLKEGFEEASGHAAGALFSLALDDRNKTAIGVLGAIPPLMRCLRAESGRARHDSAMALCHLSLVQSNRSKLVKLGSVHVLLDMVKEGHMTGRVLLVLCNLALGADGRDAMLDGGAVECFVGELECDSTRESCLVALYRLSYGGLRFKVLAKEARAEVALLKAESKASEKGGEKARRILEVLRGKEEEEEEELDWEELLNTDDAS